MKPTESPYATDAGRVVWTRDLARDLFPGATTPFAWTLLRGAAEAGLRGAYGELGAPLVEAQPFWEFRAGYVYLNAARVAAADEKLLGAAWLGRVQPPRPTGLRGRMQVGGAIKRAESRLQGIAGEAVGLQSRLSRWLTWVQGLRWAQADILQVMEELEPHAVSALQVYFLARTALNAADGQLQARLAEWLPNLSPAYRGHLYLAVEGLPSVEAAVAAHGAAQLPAADIGRLSALARYGHRGLREARPDATRWSDAPGLLAAVAEREAPESRRSAAAMLRREAESVIRGQLGGGQARQLDELLGRGLDAIRAADVAWDAFIMVMAAAQHWSVAAAREALLAGLISQPADVLFLELEELKQVATGEWHAGRSAKVQAQVMDRLNAAGALAGDVCAAGPVEVAPGGRAGPLYIAEPGCEIPPPGAAWLSESLDPGSVPFWADACSALATGCDVWTPGMITARGLGIPAMAGVRQQDIAR